jgi:Ricin-type beta-trefoil lectin domain-like
LKKGLLLLLGFMGIIAIALLPAAISAVASNGTAKSHSVHIFHSRGHARPSASVSRAASSSSNVTYHGGPVMANTTNVYAIFWEPAGSSVSANYNTLIERYFGDVGGSPLYKINNQYPQADTMFPSNAKLADSLVDTTNAYPQNPLFDSDIQAEVARAQTAKGWSSNIDNVFFVFTGKDVGLCTDISKTSCTPDVTTADPSLAFCAYHFNFGTNNTIYAAMPYAASPSFNGGCTPGTGAGPNNDDADQTINVTSHEQMEAATDPYPSLNPAWQDSGGNEIGDLCAWTFGPNNAQGADVVWNSDGYIVQQEWSNAINGCALTTNTATTYYQIVNRNSGLVLDVSGASTTQGAQVFQWSNHNGASQQWKLVTVGNNFQIVNRNSGLLLGVAGASTSAGANVIQWTANTSLDQQWFLYPDGGRDVIVNRNSGLVLDITGGSTSVGAHAFQWYYHNGLSQQWALVPVKPYYKIVNLHSGLVADITGGSTSVGAYAFQWPYHNGLSQQWALVADGAYYQIMNLHSGLVLDITGGSTSVGAHVFQWTNHNGLSQQWKLVTDGAYYQIVNRNSGLVLDVTGGGTAQGLDLFQWTNHNGLSQQWSLVATSA